VLLAPSYMRGPAHAPCYGSSEPQLLLSVFPLLLLLLLL
jgi:hypothetical protein